MSFKRTLRYVIAARAVTVLCASISLVLYSFLVESRLLARVNWAKAIFADAPLGVELTEPVHSAWGGLALVGLGLSVMWNSFSLFDLCTKNHYRFGRRVYIFVDILGAMALLVFGFMTFVYDAMIYFAMEVATKAQQAMEIVAIIFLGLACIMHIAFFCYGCKDPNVAATFEIEHRPLAGAGETNAPSLPPVRPSRSRASTYMSGHELDDLVNIDLEKKDDMSILESETVGTRSPTSPASPGRGPRLPRNIPLATHIQRMSGSGYNMI